MANLNIAVQIAASDQASGKLGDVRRALDDLGQATGRGFAGLQTLGTAALGAVAAGAVAAGAAVVGFAASGVQAAMDMEAQMSNIAAVLNMTAEEVEPLGDLIMNLGLNPNLKVTATEAALAIENLARNGLNMTQILDGAAEATVLLANATGADFGTAANIATDAMAIFNIEAEDMTDAVNGITGVTVASKFGIEDYSLALAQAGGVASAAGVEFEDFNTAITAISPLFASGSDAGTSFKTFLLRLIPASNDAKDAMRDLGIITEDGSNSFFDAEGNLRSMAEIAGVLDDALSDLSEEQRNEMLATIFGTDAMRAAVGIMETGEQGFLDLSATMSQTDALEQAATRMDNLSGVMEILGGIVDTVKLQVGNAFLPVLRMLAESLTGLVEDVGPQVVAFFEGIGTFVENLVLNFQGGQGAFDAFRNALATVVPPGVMEQITPIIDGVQNFIDTVIAFVQEHSVALTGAIQGIGVALGVAGIAALIMGIVGAIGALISPIGLVVAAAGLLGAAWSTNWMDIQGKTQTAIANITAAVASFQAMWAVFVPWFDANVVQVWAGNIANMQAIWQMGSANIVAVVDGFKLTWAALAAWFDANVVQPWAGNIDNLKIIWETGKANIEGVVEGFKLTWGALAGWFDSNVVQPLSSLVTNIQNAFTNPDWGSIGTAITDGIAGAISNGAQAIINAAQAAAQAALDAAKSLLGIQSPSKVAAEEIGKPFSQGIAVGALAGMNDMTSDVRQGLNGSLTQLAPSGAGALQSAAAGGAMSVTIDMRNSHFYGLDDIEKFIDKAVESAMARYGRRADVRIRAR